MSKYFFTDDTALAAYLWYCGFQFEPITIASSPEDKRKKYVIQDTSERKKVEEEFYLRKTLISPLDYHDARVAVSRLLKKTITDSNEVLKYM
jgi:hypothetical protein